MSYILCDMYCSLSELSKLALTTKLQDMYHFNPHFPDKIWGLERLNTLTKSTQLTSDRAWALKYYITLLQLTH